MRALMALMLALLASFSSKASYLDQLELILMSPTPVIEGQKLHSKELVNYAYQTNNYELIWQNDVAVSQLISALENAWQEGLKPQDYHLNLLHTLHSKKQHSLTFDLLLTDAVMTYATHLIRGKVNPEAISNTWNYQQYEISPKKASEQLLYHVSRNSIAQGLAKLKPKLPQYALLKDALIFYHNLPERAEIALSGRVLKPHKHDDAVPLIRQKLNDLQLVTQEQSVDSTLYSEDLVMGIKKLQSLNQLAADGIIGKDTLAILNISKKQRIETINANLERIRWVENSIDDEFLIVNIAGYELYLYQQGKLSWKTNVVVGRNYTRTPVFKGQMRYLVVNPTWTVPRSIARGIIPKVKEDIGYLDKKDFMVVDSRRNPVDANAIDWENVTARSFPYWFVQRPSEKNSLGLIKFMLPNKYSIYLHDTPAKSLFGQDQRAFSHGCVRVEEPFKLAEAILADDEKWSAQALQNTLETRETTRINLNKPLDVFLMYWTVSHNFDGLHFYSDIYQRDKKLLAKLNQPL